MLNMADENAQIFEDFMLWLHQGIINRNSRRDCIFKCYVMHCFKTFSIFMKLGCLY